MKSFRSNSAPLVLAALVLVSLSPIGLVDQALNWLNVPARAAAVLGAPMRWFESARYSSGDEKLAERRQDEGFAGADLAMDLRASAEPSAPGLRLGRRLVPAQVAGRVLGKRDSLWLEFDARLGINGIPMGAPVVFGEVFVGRVGALDPSAGRCRVDLVTGRDFYVGAIRPGVNLGGKPLRMTVGGLHGSLEPARLAVHNPSERQCVPGMVHVLEPELLTDDVAHLADGYQLGHLGEELDGLWSLDPLVDFKSGLFQLVVLIPRDAQRAPEPDPVAPLADGGWLKVAPLSTGDSLRGRRTLRISRGSVAGLEPGAALVATTRLVGRVDVGHPVAPFSAVVRLIGDPGLELHVMARIDDDFSARILGRFMGLGMDSSGAALFEWESPLGLDGLGEQVSATLYSGSGLNGLPGGLYLGTASLPTTAGRHVVRLENFADGLGHGELWVREEAGK